MNYVKTRHAVSHLETAKVYAKNSYATRLKVGAFLVRGDIPIAMGWNGRLPGQPNECEDTLPDGTTRTRSDVRHAEVNALNKLHRSNESARGAVMYCTHAACIQCAADMVQAGVAGFIYAEEYRDREGIIYLLNNGIQVYKETEAGLVQLVYRSFTQGIQELPLSQDLLYFKLP